MPYLTVTLGPHPPSIRSRLLRTCLELWGHCSAGRDHRGKGSQINLFLKGLKATVIMLLSFLMVWRGS